jgi:hypothetical protein
MMYGLRQWLISAYCLLTYCFRLIYRMDYLAAYFSSATFWVFYGHRPHRKNRVQQFFSCCVCICCCGNVFTEPLPSNGRLLFHYSGSQAICHIAPCLWLFTQHSTRRNHCSLFWWLRSGRVIMNTGLWRNVIFEYLRMYCDMHACLRPLLSNGPRSTVNSGNAC